MKQGNLNAKDDAYVPLIYSQKLDELISDPNIKNIAVTAPYDSGKTTILKSYFKKRELRYKLGIRYTNHLIFKLNKIKQDLFFRPNLLSAIKDYEFINIPNFFNITTDITGKEDSTEYNDQSVEKAELEAQLEKSIIEQLLYKPNYKKYPDSNLNRLRTHSLLSILISFVYFVFLFGYIVRIYGDKSKFRWLNSLWIWNNHFFQSISFLILSIGSFILFSFLIRTLGKIKLHATTKMGPLELTGDSEEKDVEVLDLFNYYGDELQYYFKQNNTRIVIFEDLDRFKNPLIFQKLRELNNNLNKDGANITFIYSLKDKVFDVENSDTNPAALKAKFFDFIIPIFPIHSYRDSSKTFIYESEQYKLITSNNKKVNYFKERDNELEQKKNKNIKIKENYLRGIGLYISDTREIKNIISETYFYFSELPLKIFDPDQGGTPNAINKVLAMIVYKNEFPEDFDNLASGKKSGIECFINGIDDFRLELLNKKTEENNKKIDSLNFDIKQLESELITDVDILMQIRLKELINNTTNHVVKENNTYYDAEDGIDNIHEFWKEAFDNELKYEDYWGHSHDIKNLNEIEKSIFRSYLLKGTTGNESLLKWKESKKKLENKNEKIQEEIFSLEIKDLFVEYLNNNDEITNANFKFITDHPVLEYLVKQGLIEFDYTDYISPDPYSLTSAEEHFVRIVNNHQSINTPNYRLLRVNRVIKEINLLDDSVNTYQYAYSPDVLAFFAIENNKVEYLDVLVKSAYKKDQPQFILTTIEILVGKSVNLDALFTSISKSWKTYYKDVFSSTDGDLKKQLARQLLSCLANPDFSTEIFNPLKEQKIFENKQFENELLVLAEDKLIQIFKCQTKYDYPNLLFVANYSIEKLKQFIIYKWYQENNINFKIIFTSLANHNLSLFLNKVVATLSISKEYVKQNIFEYYSNEKNATYDDIVSLTELIQEQKKEDDLDPEKYLKVLNVYLDTKEDFNNQVKERILLKDLHLVDLIKEKQFDNNTFLHQLLKNKKIIYNDQIFDALYDNYRDMAKKYALKFESINTIPYFFYNRQWSFVMSCVEDTRFIKKWVELIDEDAKKTDPQVGWSQVEISNKVLSLLARYTSSVNVIREVIAVVNNLDIKAIILKTIFSKPQFKNQFTKQEISKMLFNDSDFIDSWKIDGKHQVSNQELRKEYGAELRQLYDAVPQTFKKKRTQKYIFLKSFDNWFKKSE